jgi:hypothetical protein
MATFKDKNGIDWTIDLDTPKIRAVRAATCDVEGCRHRPKRDKECEAVDLSDEDGGAYELLSEDPGLLVDVIFMLCRDQAQARGMTDVQFGESLVGDAFDAAARALVEAGAAFFPSSKRRLLLALVGAQARMEKKAIDRAIQATNDPRLEAKLDEELERRAEELTNRMWTHAPSQKNSPDTAESTLRD